MISIFTTLIRSISRTYNVTDRIVAREWVAYKPTGFIRSLSRPTFWATAYIRSLSGPTIGFGPTQRSIAGLRGPQIYRAYAHTLREIE